ncbi:DUF4932 domain-containing protein [Flavobacterium aquatile]|uniref:DUF4932 domain-containing protein n=1 Tax=Flavobacterium aquatile LMG 4008 = ATCC 11947 TaxID=1453498 RepID=A0A095TWU2_9FLAO|nr:DUF4932 domain-containing protein [Flavobacterium aquatile]KGD66843.1 hypothetical protein LG45_15545 [Flavobacterium aquatile LMG 4008 = ATCC 11947]OXA67937.1 DUF4932 domain-containing protein [Flavobacterium aquatile LMG 4008 = ATCC 11947]GEC78651.1 hypothetical protein FAQ01_15210 [Flavobacterium aquatile]
MKTFILSIFLISINFVSGQYIKENISKTYFSENDSITFKYSNYPEVFKLDLSENDTLSPGTNIAKDITMTAYIGKDTLVIKGDNYPFARKSFITIKTPRRTTVVIFRFNASSSNFSQEYIHENQGKFSIVLSEVFELANIIWALSPSGQAAINLQKDTEYYRKVEKYFQPYLDHPIFKKLILKNKNDYSDTYYQFRENSFMYEFNGNKILKGENYNYVYGNDWQGFTNLFTELLPLVQDFSDKSNFRAFYKKNKKYYSNDLKRITELMPIKNMWNWLEKEFPIKQNSYKIVFSPLIGGSHSTQNYSGKDIKNNSWFSECVMFICNANRYDLKKDITEKQKEVLMSGIVFTEIDHNYVNPTSNKYKKEIAEIFKGKIWTDEKNMFYENPQSVFNEYMTHSVFCVWVKENYDKKTSDYLINERIKMNVDRRGFIKFKEFNEEMIRLMDENPTKTVAEIYPQIIDWAKKEN